MAPAKECAAPECSLLCADYVSLIPTLIILTLKLLSMLQGASGGGARGVGVFPLLCAEFCTLGFSRGVLSLGCRRAHQPGECAASECSLLCADYTRLGHHRFVLDPGVRLVRLSENAKP